MAMRMRISLTCVPMAISNRRSSKTSCRANTFLSYYFDDPHNHHNNWLNHLKYLCHLRDDQLGKIHSRIVTGVDHLEIHRKPCDLYIIGAVCVSVSKSHYLLGKLFWQVNFFLKTFFFFLSNVSFRFFFKNLF